MATLTLTIHKSAHFDADTDDATFARILSGLGKAGIHRDTAFWAGQGTPTSTLTLMGVALGDRERATEVVVEQLAPASYYPAL